MPRVVNLCFRQAGKSYYFAAGDLELLPGDRVVVKTTRGQELGLVRSFPFELPKEQLKDDLKPVLRTATEEDLARAQQNESREREALLIATEKVAKHNLEMKLIEAETTLDGSHMVIHFSSEGRIDFRALVRDLARALKTRVELHQIGVRDEAKMRGGIGHCGRSLCCATFLTDFDPVGIKMAKDQDLSLNPQKISGICGRLMCCLNFEHAHYRETRQCLPKIGSQLETQEGLGRVDEIDFIRGIVKITLEEGRDIFLPLADVVRHHAGCPHLVTTPDFNLEEITSPNKEDE